MTIIVGLEHNGRVHLGADSSGVDGWRMTMRSDTKVFRNGPYAIGFTSSFRMGQILRYAFDAPDPPSQGLERFMCSSFVDAVRDAFKGKGYATTKDGADVGGTFLIGVSGHLFTMYEDYQVERTTDGFNAIGCGRDIAAGVLFVTKGSPRQRLATALKTTERYSCAVRGPFNYVTSAP